MSATSASSSYVVDHDFEDFQRDHMWISGLSPFYHITKCRRCCVVLGDTVFGVRGAKRSTWGWCCKEHVDAAFKYYDLSDTDNVVETANPSPEEGDDSLGDEHPANILLASSHKCRLCAKQLTSEVWYIKKTGTHSGIVPTFMYAWCSTAHAELAAYTRFHKSVIQIMYHFLPKTECHFDGQWLPQEYPSYRCVKCRECRGYIGVNVIGICKDSDDASTTSSTHPEDEEQKLYLWGWCGMTCASKCIAESGIVGTMAVADNHSGQGNDTFVEDIYKKHHFGGHQTCRLCTLDTRDRDTYFVQVQMPSSKHRGRMKFTYESSWCSPEHALVHTRNIPYKRVVFKNPKDVQHPEAIFEEDWLPMAVTDYTTCRWCFAPIEYIHGRKQYRKGQWLYLYGWCSTECARKHTAFAPCAIDCYLLSQT